MKRITLIIAAVALAAGFSSRIAAQNPYLPLWETIPDGEPYVFEDPDTPGKYRVYIYGSHDRLITAYCGLDQVVWSAPVEDLSRWRFDGVIFESKKDANGNLLHEDGRGDVLYAPDVAETKDENGRKVYYLYPNVQNRGRGNLVAKSYRPDGPFEVCNWSDTDPARTVGPFAFDPAAFVDDDGRAYGYWGFGVSNGAELDPATMSTVKPGAQVVRHMVGGYREDNTFRFYEASSIRKIKDKYVFIYSRTTNEGEFGLPSSNYTLAYAFSNNPLGPWTYGGTIIDGRGREKRADGSTVATATPNGNTHGSICEINGKWYVFYHRQAGTDEYSRQAMVAPIDVEVVEGESGYVRISEAEFTSEGFATDGLDPLQRCPAGIACYMTGPTPAWQEYPKVHYSGSHTNVIYADEGYSLEDPYDPAYNRSQMVNNTDGSVVGYKYFNLSKTFGRRNLSLILGYIPEGVAGRMEVWLDRPCAEDGGVKVGSFKIPSKSGDGNVKTARIKVRKMKHFNGKHALFFVFSSPTQGESLCTLEDFHFE